MKLFRTGLKGDIIFFFVLYGRNFFSFGRNFLKWFENFYWRTIFENKHFSQDFLSLFQIVFGLKMFQIEFFHFMNFPLDRLKKIWILKLMIRIVWNHNCCHSKNIHHRMWEQYFIYSILQNVKIDRIYTATAHTFEGEKVPKTIIADIVVAVVAVVILSFHY